MLTERVRRGEEVIEKLSICKKVKTKEIKQSSQKSKVCTSFLNYFILGILKNSFIWILSTLLAFVCCSYIP